MATDNEPQKMTASSKGKKAPGAAELVALRNRFFYVYYRRMSLIFLAALGLCAFALVCAFYFATRQTPPVYVPIGADGRIVQTFPLDQPSNPDEEKMRAIVAQWALDGMRKLFTLDYLNFAEQVNAAQPYFTYRGWDSTLRKMAESQNFNTVQQQKMIVMFTPTGAPLIQKQQVIGGRMAWALDLPAAIKYIPHDGAHAGTVQNVTIHLVVVRMSTVDSPKGIGIDQMLVEEVVRK